MAIENSIKIAEPPKFVRDYVFWEKMTEIEKKVFTVVVVGLEIASLQALSMLALPQYNIFVWDTLEKVTNSIFGNNAVTEVAQPIITQDQVTNTTPTLEITPIKNVTKTYENTHKLELELEQLDYAFNEAGKEIVYVKVKNEIELKKAIKDIEGKSDEEKKDFKFLIEIQGEINITEDTKVNAQGKQPTEQNTYFETTAGLVLPEGVTLKIQGKDKTKDKLTFANQKIGIYGQNLGDVTFSDLTISRNGTDEQEFLKGEMVRSVIFLTTKREGVLSQANIQNVDVINNIHIPKTDQNFYLLPSGIVTSGFYDVQVTDSLVQDFYWDSIASFNGGSLAITGSQIVRLKENYITNAGAAVALISDAVNPIISINNSKIFNYSKYVGMFGNDNGTIDLTDLSVSNEVEPGIYLVTNSKILNMERVVLVGKGIEEIVRGYPPKGSTINITESGFIISRGHIENYSEPNDLIELFSSPSIKVSNSTICVNNSITKEEEALFKKLGMNYFVYPE